MNADRTALLTNDKIELSFEYNMDIILKVREIQGRKWDAKLHIWTIPFTPWHSSQVASIGREFGFYMDPGILANANGKARKPDLVLPDRLYPHQKDGVKFVYQTGGRCIIADEMGVGKTAIALTFVDQFCGKTLVVAPANVIWKWKYECEDWTGKTAEVVTKAKQSLPDSDLHIMSYTIMTLKYEQLKNIPYNCIILDESHYIKSHRTRRTRVAKALIKGSPHAMFLSGTPFMNRPLELFTSLNMLDPKGYSNFWHYAVRYCGAEYWNGQWILPPNGATNLNELAERLQHIMIRRTKADVNLGLPELSRSYLPMEIDNRTEYNQARRDIKAWYAQQDRETLNPDHALTRLNVLRQVVGSGKVAAAIELAEDILNSNDRVVLFAHHKQVVADLADGLRTYGVGIISGDVKPKERQRLISVFLKETLSAEDPLRVMIITVAGAEGINLFSASNIIFVEREWVPAIEEQAEARLHRIGQRNAVTAHYLIARNTVDDKLAELVRLKRGIFGQVIRQDVIRELLEAL